MTHNVTDDYKRSGQNVPIFILTVEMNSWCPFTYEFTYDMQICAKLAH